MGSLSGTRRTAIGLIEARCASAFCEDCDGSDELQLDCLMPDADGLFGSDNQSVMRMIEEYCANQSDDCRLRYGRQSDHCDVPGRAAI